MSNETKQSEQDISLQQAMDLVTGLQGPESLETLMDEINKAIQSKRQQITHIQGEIAGFTKVKQLIEIITNRTQPSVPEDNKVDADSVVRTPVTQEQITGGEIAKRVSDGLCTYKKRTGGKGSEWCGGKLSSKEEKEHGYCTPHLVELGLKKEDIKSTTKPKRGRRKKSTKKSS